MEREQQLKKGIAECLEREENDCEGKVQLVNTFMLKIQLLKQEIVSSAQEDDIEILRQAKKRTSMCEEIKGSKSKELVAHQVNA